MAAADRATTLIQNEEATPIVMNATLLAGGRKRCIIGTIETADADADAAVYALCRLQANWSVTSIRIFNDAVTNGTQADLGLYTGTSSSITAASAACYATNISLAAANRTGSTVTDYKDWAWETRDINTIGQKVYQDAGDAEGDFPSYLLCITMNDVDSASTISFIVEYVDGT